MLANITITGSSSLSEAATGAMGTIGGYAAFLIGIVLGLYIIEALVSHFRNKNDVSNN